MSNWKVGSRHIVERNGSCGWTYHEATVLEVSPSGKKVKFDPFGWCDNTYYRSVEALPATPDLGGGQHEA